MTGFIAATLFAVMPMTWLFRRVFLNTILMPFLLSSILFAVYLRVPHNTVTIVQNRNNEEYHNYKSDKGHHRSNINNNSTNKDINTSSAISPEFDRRKILLVIISGIFLGLSIFTKNPVITMIPLVGFLVFTNSNRSLKALGLWFAPIILIPLIGHTLCLKASLTAG
jgi:4-amino-4-deoxy-L-arabinose transferase-like glycosyltransferase